MKKIILFMIFVLATGLVLFQSCEEEESAGPPKAQIFFSIVDKQVAFTALTKRVESWDWEFGDGESSTEQNPVHIYDDGGYYDVVLTGTDKNGVTAVSSVSIAVAVTPYVLLTGGPTNPDGKTWKLTASHSTNDKLVNADATFTLADPDIPVLPQGAFSLFLGMGEVYEDTYTFHYDGSYSHDTKADNAAFAGIVHQFLTTGGANIVNDGGSDFGLCTALYTPQAGATFTYVEEEDFTVASVYGPGGQLTYPGVSTLDFSGTEFVGFWDYQSKVIVQEITDKTMRLVMFMSASATYYPLNTHALILTFSLVE
ncbi:MAG TPA: PKD domain-containing protein [Bacteroidales bacterium]|nr:PKD domain-containing protein [Bacteroidales bacterium]HPF02133.1 PKD domain-containing protein [Bacteroidales bacterium]HPJ58142.1 PKD domain-containing protein [Bacteroidales bacterium]HPR11473.1 PKD domain-containing protein [Bacteroidales bacterium]HRW84552.1 PKD domain-containing protein [Bacteroidales bacterium]